MKETFLVLHNIRSVYNVGSIFRTADSFSVDKIYLTGYTPRPLDKFGRERKDIHKTALGAEKNISWEFQKDIKSLLKELKERKFLIIAVEQDKSSKDYKEVQRKNKTAIVFGNEVRGLSKKILKQADIVAEIPMKGEKESLNVSVAAGVALSRILNI